MRKINKLKEKIEQRISEKHEASAEIKLDWKLARERQKAAIVEAQSKWDKQEKDEKHRIETMRCPCCKSTIKKNHVTSKNNGIIGPGYHSYITNDFWICQSCGTHYSDLNKKDLGNRPEINKWM